MTFVLLAELIVFPLFCFVLFCFVLFRKGVRVGRPPRPRRREDKSQARDDSEKAVDGGIIDNSPRISENDNNEDVNINDDGATTAQSKAQTKKGPPPPPTAPPPPSSAPPRRAKDILDSIGGSNGKLRKSMDEIIAETGMRKSFEAKGGGADADDSLDNAVDFKVSGRACVFYKALFGLAERPSALTAGRNVALRYSVTSRTSTSGLLIDSRYHRLFHLTTSIRFIIMILIFFYLIFFRNNRRLKSNDASQSCGRAVSLMQMKR
jgi:hypothetical protein